MNESWPLPIKRGVAPVSITARNSKYEGMNARLRVVALVASELRGRSAGAARFMEFSSPPFSA